MFPRQSGEGTLVLMTAETINLNSRILRRIQQKDGRFLTVRYDQILGFVSLNMYVGYLTFDLSGELYQSVGGNLY